jgi:hypothetical protein
MSKNRTSSKPTDAEQLSGEGLDETHCSSPTPWKKDGRGNIISEDGTIVAKMVGCGKITDANAKIILERINSKRIQIEVHRADCIPAFGGWCAGSMKENEPTILLNVAACLLPCVDENGEEIPHTTEEKKWLMISTLMHEFGHALQEFFDLEMTEERVEELAAEYEKFYLTNV